MKRKKQEHCYRVRAEYKANEKFSGKGHAAHICKACKSLPIEKRNELEKINRVDLINEQFFISKENLKWLRKCANDYRYMKLNQHAQDVLDSFHRHMDDFGVLAECMLIGQD